MVTPGNGRPGRTTRADVARLAGVSPAVVSYVTQGGPRPVAPETERRVREAIAALDYRPNRSAQALRTGSARLLGMIVPEFENAIWTDLSLVTSQIAAERGYDLIIASSEQSVEIERHHARNFASRVDGLLLTSVVMTSPDIKGLKAAAVPTVLLNVFEGAEGIDSIGVDAQAGARQATGHLVEHGYTTIGHIVDPGQRGPDPREVGWRATLTEAGIPLGPLEYAPFTRRGGYEAGRLMFGRPDRPRAVFVSCDMQALGLLRALWELGLRVPEDVAIVAFDGTVDAEYATPPLTAVEQPIAQMARWAIDLVLQTNRDGRTPPARVVEQPRLVIRRSCGCTSDPAESD